jgi:hypothetical protein
MHKRFLRHPREVLTASGWSNPSLELSAQCSDPSIACHYYSSHMQYGLENPALSDNQPQLKFLGMQAARGLLLDSACRGGCHAKAARVCAWTDALLDSCQNACRAAAIRCRATAIWETTLRSCNSQTWRARLVRRKCHKSMNMQHAKRRVSGILVVKVYVAGCLTYSYKSCHPLPHKIHTMLAGQGVV